ncbi:ubiquitin-related domain-containing protein [Mycotypha africana]|uniref:ubiquitin-related domain-containing protein n=1 Tax=Mycotypha africana TaxID=64632 RepID=UPI002301F2E3|nr:ubiquitin-related domain-containing protein [Mycotypha africana]KAI8970332.1 ubiquitin-related domain-containing protein [Mycotypha africana]
MQSSQSELDFINYYLENLSSKSVRYGEDYLSRTLPDHLRIKKFVSQNESFSLSIAPAPTTAAESITLTTDSNKFEIIIKVLKPFKQFTITGLTATDTVGQLKKRIYQQQSSFPANRQRLLLKGKVLADQKTLEEHSIGEGAIVHLMLTAAPAATSSQTITDDAAAVASLGTNITSSSASISAETDRKLSSPEFWSAVEKTVIEQVGQTDAAFIVNKMKAVLSP